MKNIISFSLYGDKKLYPVGALKNALLQKTVYPEWTCRFYVDDKVPKEVIEQLKDYGSEIIEKGPSRNFIGSFWRYEVAFDPSVDRYAVRDCDSRLNDREYLAVKEWISEGTSFHIMRDHPNHLHVIMAGMWGGISGKVPEFEQIYTNYIKQSNGEFWSDMYFLETLLWDGYIKKNHTAHDEYFKPLGIEKPFPIKLVDEYSFVGNKYDENDKPVYSVNRRD
jgi:hypothetical protein